MDGNKDEVPSEAAFALMIKKTMQKGGKASFNIESNNTGIPDAEVILYVECWLETVKKNFKKVFDSGFHSAGKK